MHKSYHDITSRIPEPPKWWDENGVPRYDDFSYNQLGVYIRYAILALIECQSCGKHMKIGIGYDQHRIFVHRNKNEESCTSIEITDIAKEVENFNWGDPPSHGCVGDTMISTPKALLEVWQMGPDERGGIKEGNNYITLREIDFEWQRKPELEGLIEDPLGL